MDYRQEVKREMYPAEKKRYFIKHCTHKELRAMLDYCNKMVDIDYCNHNGKIITFEGEKCLLIQSSKLPVNTDLDIITCGCMESKRTKLLTFAWEIFSKLVGNTRENREMFDMLTCSRNLNGYKNFYSEIDTKEDKDKIYLTRNRAIDYDKLKEELNIWV